MKYLFAAVPGTDAGQNGYWYRYIETTECAFNDDGDFITSSSLKLGLLCFRVQKTTPKGVWILAEHGNNRFVLRDARKRFACPTKEEALASFIARKERQQHILQVRLERTVEALGLAKRKAEGLE